MNIAIDMMGGDFAPREAVKGVKRFLDRNQKGVYLTLIGDHTQLQPLIEQYEVPRENIRVVHASQCIDMHEHPTKALKTKPDSSIAKGFEILAAGNTDAFISAGNTGAMMVGSLYSIKAIEGVSRPAIGTFMPTENGELSVLIDIGLNSDCKPEHLLQFAILGSLFAKHILNFETPRVALLNMGEEEGKGNLVSQSAYGLLKNCEKIHFIGNAEGRDILKDKAEIYVCDGFTGNILLKFAESFFDIIKERRIEDEYFNRFNYEMYGGVPVLGVNKPVIIGHGISGEEAFMNMIHMALKMIENDFIEKIKNNFT